jgi:hypothetical protein
MDNSSRVLVTVEHFIPMKVILVLVQSTYDDIIEVCSF